MREVGRLLVDTGYHSARGLMQGSLSCSAMLVKCLGAVFGGLLCQAIGLLCESALLRLQSVAGQ